MQVIYFWHIVSNILLFSRVGNSKGKNYYLIINDLYSDNPMRDFCLGTVHENMFGL